MGLKSNFQERYELYGGDVVLTFDPEPHVYKLEATGEVIPSTTSITKVIDKPALINWAVTETVNFLDKVLVPNRGYSKIAITAMLDAATKARFEVSNEALEVGNLVHNWLEEFGEAYLAHSDHMPLIPEHPMAQAGCQAFLDWVRVNNVEFIATETKVYHPHLKYSGTFDLLAWVNGQLCIVDYKTSKRIYDEYFLQGAAYAKAYECEQEVLYAKGLIPEPLRIEKIIVLRVPKDGSKFEVGESIDIDNLFEVYGACLQIHDWQTKRKHWSNRERRSRERHGVRGVVFDPLADQGWGFPTPRALKAHYFRRDEETGETKSLCNKYEWDQGSPLDDSQNDHINNCDSCKKKMSTN